MNSVTFAISGGNDDGVFAININTGLITVADSSSLDFETTRSYTLTVTASDGTTTNTAEITVNVTNIDETPPSIDNAQASIAEDAILGAEVIDINDANTSDDSDTDDANGQALQYSITAGNTGNAFAINLDTGIITVADPSSLDFETTRSYTLTVEANDGTATDTAEITVNVTNIDETPPSIDNAQASIAEDAILGAEVIDINDANTLNDSDTDDADGQALQYSITAGNTGNAFAINLDTGLITVADPSSLDFETTRSYTLTVEANDGTATDTAEITVNVTNIDETPPSIDDAQASIAENAMLGTEVHDVNNVDGNDIDADDADGQALQYRITNGNTGNAFAIDANTGVITLVGALDFETAISYMLTVEANDGTATDTAMVTVNVTDENDDPVLNDTAFIVSSMAMDNDVVGTVMATDADRPANTLSYRIIDGGTDLDGLFTIDSSGVIRIPDNTNLGNVIGASRTLNIEVSDSVGGTDTATITVQVRVPIAAMEASAIQMDNNLGGFVLNGVSEDDRSGGSVSGVGDVNGDGLNDIIIGANQADGPNGNDSGASYVVFGKTNGGAVQLSDIADTNDNAGFVLNGANVGDRSGISVSGAGDVNGDGLDDIIIGARVANGSRGASYVVFGKTDGGAVELGEIGGDDNDGFVLNGMNANDRSGASVSGAGDINGDGLDDIIIGAYQADGMNGNDSGASYVVFGKTDGGIVELSTIANADENDNAGFVLNGANANDQSGTSVSGAGDINGDGLDDLIIGANLADGTDGNNSGASYVVFGKTDGRAVELGDIGGDDNDGFVLNGVNAGDRSGTSVSGAGDINGDGLDDIIIGANQANPNGTNSGASYVVFGKTDGVAVQLNDIADNAGFVINGVDANDRSGVSVSGAGDINGDGLDDIIIGANQADPNANDSGASYLVFGKTDGNAVELSLVEEFGIGGFVINGAGANDQSGRSVSGAGDVNGDGFDDLIVGARLANPNDNDSGASYVIFGGQGVLASAIVYDGTSNTLTGDSMVNQLIGGAGDDTLIGNGGADVLRGGRGDDVLAISDADFAVIDGGLGNDTLRLDSAITLNLADIPNNRLDSIEIINLNDTTSTLILATDDILNIVGSSAQNTLRIDGSSTDSLDISQTGFFDSGLTESGTDYQIYLPDPSLVLDDSVTLLVDTDVRVDGALTGIADIELAAVQNGFAINGASAADQIGGSVSTAGDFNGDGFADLLIASAGTNDTGDTVAVVFGETTGSNVELSMLGSNGFSIEGLVAESSSINQFSVSGAGDVNGDGLDDIIIGASSADPNSNDNSGASYVVFGSTDSGSIALSDIADANNDTGFVLNGANAGDYSGRSVSGAGDVNGDGLDDILIGASSANGNSGASYVVFGKSDGGIVELSMIDNDDGFVINGVNADDQSGRSVSGAGDINGDGLDDILIGASDADPNSVSNSGASYVVFGKASGSAVELSEVADNNAGFVLNGVTMDDQSGFSVSGAGDVNGDGLDDIIIGAHGANGSSGASYVVFGKTDGGIVELSTIDDDTGFVINGVGSNDQSGYSVSGAGDINGDGLDDILIGANQADPNDSESGASYLVFGKRDDNAVELAFVELGIGGFVINGASADDQSGISVSGAGDVNGDGFDDLLVGADQADPNSVADSGASYVIFGGQGVSASAIVYDGTSNTLTGDDMANQIIGGAGDDTLIGNGGEDVLRGGAGNDVFEISDTDFAIIDGGLGTDTLRLSSELTLDLTSIPNNRLDSIEIIDLNDTASTLILVTDDILSIVGSSAQNTLRIDGTSADTLYIGAPFGDSGVSQAIGETNYQVYQASNSLRLDDSVSLLIDPDVSVEIIIFAVELSAIQMSGFVLNGAAFNDQSGGSVSGAGDVNGDGLDDIIVGAYGVNGSNGASYVVFGKSDGDGGIVELSMIAEDDDNDGFVLNGASGGDRSGRSVSDAGDVNGDGLDDIIIGAHLADGLNGEDSGASYVVFGKASGGAVELSDIAEDAGFVINGVALNDQSGRSVSGAGDVNGDGLDDILIGAFQAEPDGDGIEEDDNRGASYVVFGKTDGGVVELSMIDNNTGFVINGAATGDISGGSVSGAGDVNGDGLDDILIGASDANGNRGASYVVFGKASGGAVELSDIDDDDGFFINGANRNDSSGGSVSGAGDVNGDGLDDIIIGAIDASPNGNRNSGASYVVFGKTDGRAVGLREIGGDDNDGFVLNGVDEGDQSGRSVSGAGDINGDGLDDIIVGAREANGSSGASYLVFGKSDGNAVELSLIEELGIGGFVINGVNADDQSGVSVSGAGDVNGDGFDDLIVGAYRAAPNGNSNSGASYVIFGGQGVLASADIGDEMANTLTGDGMANQLIGGAGDDALLGMGGADVLRGGRGDDVFEISDTDFAIIDGGSGNDTLRLSSGLTLDLTSIPNNHLDSIEIINLNGANDNGSTLILATDDILNIVGNSAQNTLQIDGSSADTLDISQARFFDSDDTIDGTGYQIYLPDPSLGLDDSVSLLVDPDVSVDGALTAIDAIELSANDQGFVLNGVGNRNQTFNGGYSVSGAGDVNGDGLDDIIVGVYNTAPTNSNPFSGVSYVVFGKASGGAVELSDIADTNDNAGFVLNGVNRFDTSGRSVSGAGDVNGDGLDDIIVGAYQADPNGNSNSGASYVVFGKTDGGAVELGDIGGDDNDGFVLNGANSSDFSGRSVSGAGDINGDGLADIIVGADRANSNSGVSYVVFGKASGDVVELSDIADNNAGFVLNGANMYDYSGTSVSGAGDINGDGLDDIIVGADRANSNRGASYVVFGKTSGGAVQLDDIADDAGFVLNGANTSDYSGYSVSGAGDINGDGFDDLIVGAILADGPNGNNSGASYVVFGKTDGLPYN